MPRMTTSTAPTLVKSCAHDSLAHHYLSPADARGVQASQHTPFPVGGEMGWEADESERSRHQSQVAGNVVVHGSEVAKDDLALSPVLWPKTSPITKSSTTGNANEKTRVKGSRSTSFISTQVSFVWRTSSRRVLAGALGEARKDIVSERGLGNVEVLGHQKLRATRSTGRPRPVPRACRRRPPRPAVRCGAPR